jgi:hypothetical protein
MTHHRELARLLGAVLAVRQRAQGLTEYGLILVVCSIAAVVLIVAMGPKVAAMFSGAGVSLK